MANMGAGSLRIALTISRPSPTWAVIIYAGLTVSTHPTTAGTLTLAVCILRGRSRARQVRPEVYLTVRSACHYAAAASVGPAAAIVVIIPVVGVLGVAVVSISGRVGMADDADIHLPLPLLLTVEGFIVHVMEAPASVIIVEHADATVPLVLLLRLLLVPPIGSAIVPVVRLNDTCELRPLLLL